MPVDFNRLIDNPQKLKSALENVRSTLARANYDRIRPFSTFDPRDKEMDLAKASDYILAVRTLFQQIQRAENRLSANYKDILPLVLSREIEGYIRENGLFGYAARLEVGHSMELGDFARNVVILMEDAFRRQANLVKTSWQARYNQEFKDLNPNLILALTGNSNEAFNYPPNSSNSPTYQNQFELYLADNHLYSLGIRSLREIREFEENGNGQPKPYELLVVDSVLLNTAKTLSIIFAVSKVWDGD